jgi:hypothetical protein
MNRWYHPEFETELIAAARYYEQQSFRFGHDIIAIAKPRQR